MTSMMSDGDCLGSSFRDPSGFVFRREGVVLRQINDCYREEWEHLISSGLHDSLASDGLLIPHENLTAADGLTESAYHVIRPEQIPFISHPYEWTFGQLKAAALLTLEIQRRALDHGMSLKDASAFNVQFLGSRPVFIDTLSFGMYDEGRPWTAYRQFCEHFLAPLALMAYIDPSLGVLQRLWIDGMPLQLASTLLPLRCRLRLPLLTHIHLHGRSQARHQDDATPIDARTGHFSRLAMTGLIDSLQGAVNSLNWEPSDTEWSDYYDATNYSEGAMAHKKREVARLIGRIAPDTVWDLGANTGDFSEIARDAGALVIAMDSDHGAAQRQFQRCAESGEERILPLVMDLNNPSPDLGWSHAERESLGSRGPADMALALALVHHLAIGNNAPLPMIADFFAQICQALLIEFVPKEDSQVQRMLASREDIFDDYRQESFENAFAEQFVIEEKVAVEDSVRTLYLMRKGS